jgi:tight adherence protein C
VTLTQPLAALPGLDPGVLLWPLLFGLGAYLLLTAQPIGRPKPDLAQQLRRLDVEARLQAESARAERRPIFASRLLEGLLRPFLDDLGRVLRSALGNFGLAGSRELERKLALLRPGVDPTQFLGEKVASALIGLAIFPFMNLLGVHPFGEWPVWTWALGLLAGFLAPDRQIEWRLAAHRTRCLMELPTILDLLTIAISAGLAIEQAFEQVSTQSGGVIAGELRLVSRELALGQRPLGPALTAMAERNALPELTSFADQVRASLDQGIPLVHTLSIQAESLREKKRLRIAEEGGKASVRMVFPVALFILPVLFVVLLFPAAVQLLSLGG